MRTEYTEQNIYMTYTNISFLIIFGSKFFYIIYRRYALLLDISSSGNRTCNCHLWKEEFKLLTISVQVALLYLEQ